MKILKYVLSLALVCTFLIGCKDTATSKVKGKEIAVNKKEITVAAKPAEMKVNIEGMTCAMGCAKAIEQKLAGMDGVQNATVNFDEKVATVNYDLAVLSSDVILKSIESAADGKTYKAKEVTKG